MSHDCSLTHPGPVCSAGGGIRSGDPAAPPSAAVPDPADVEKAARAIAEAEGAHGPSYFPCKCGWDAGFGAGWEDRGNRHRLLSMAAAALAAVRPSPDSEVVARVRDLADQLDEDADAADQLAQGWLDVGSHADRDRCLALADDRRENADRIRAALGTGDREGQ